MILQDEREQVAEYGRKLISFGLTKGTGGNISIYNREKNLMALSPSSMDYSTIMAKDVVILDLDGNKVDGDKNQSSEYNMHRIFYKNSTEVNSVVHTHADYSTVLAILQWEVEPVHYLIGYAGKKVRVAPYHIFGSQELAEAAYEYSIGSGIKACLLANHGLIAAAHTVDFAFNIAEEIEYVCKLYYLAKLAGTPTKLTSDEMDAFLLKCFGYTTKQK